MDPVHESMYASQAAVFQEAAAYRQRKRTLTTTACTQSGCCRGCGSKKTAISRLPTQCVHCKTPLNTPSCIQEISCGDIMAYCRGAGGCGRSQVLWSAIPLTVPVYKQVCVFTAPPKPAAPHQTSKQDDAQQAIDVYALHGIVPPDTLCTVCHRRYDQHEQGYDTNGWVAVPFFFWPSCVLIDFVVASACAFVCLCVCVRSVARSKWIFRPTGPRGSTHSGGSAGLSANTISR